MELFTTGFLVSVTAAEGDIANPVGRVGGALINSVMSASANLRFLIASVTRFWSSALSLHTSYQYIKREEGGESGCELEGMESRCVYTESSDDSRSAAAIVPIVSIEVSIATLNSFASP